MLSTWNVLYLLPDGRTNSHVNKFIVFTAVILISTLSSPARPICLWLSLNDRTNGSAKFDLWGYPRSMSAKRLTFSVPCDLSLLFLVSAFLEYIPNLHISCVTATSWYGYLQTVKLFGNSIGWVGIKISLMAEKNHKWNSIFTQPRIWATYREKKLTKKE